MADGVKEIMDELGTVLETIDSMDERFSVAVASFIDDKLIDPDDLSTYSLALQYAKWAMTHSDKILENATSYHCKCFRGSRWNLDSGDGSDPKVHPCDRCSPSQYQYWKSGFIGDSDQPPRGADDF